MITGETGRRFLTALIPVAVVHNFVYGIVITQIRHMAVLGALEMILIYKHVTWILVLVSLF